MFHVALGDLLWICSCHWPRLYGRQVSGFVSDHVELHKLLWGDSQPSMSLEPPSARQSRKLKIWKQCEVVLTAAELAPAPAQTGSMNHCSATVRMVFTGPREEDTLHQLGLFSTFKI